jgi:2,3-diketo-5-methylthio-1-phosphopentane phosphatase
MKGNFISDPLPGEGNPRGRLLVVCDFDGTVCSVDMCNEILERFAGDWEAIDRSYASGEFGSREAYGRIAPLIAASRSQMVDFVLSRERLDPSFPEFQRFCRERGIGLKIVSDGLDFSIETILRKHGLVCEYFSNRVVFRGDDRIGFEFPEMSEDCGRCGTCKRSLLDRFRQRYGRIFYVGDGHSDVCAARAADRVFGKAVLYDKCRQNGTPCIPYRDFGDLLPLLEKTLSEPAATGLYRGEVLRDRKR